MMFSLVALVGKRVRINQTWHQGLDRQSIIDANQEQFPALALGWINDGTQVHEELVHQPCLATSSRHGPLSAWADGTGYGADMRAIDDKPFGIEAHFEGPKGYGRFQVWGDPSYQLATPAAVFDWHTRLGGVHVVGWPRFNFEGDFCHPNGTESLAGIGYFQRVCFNLPLPPWKWVYVVFEDGSIFSATLIYAGPHALRRGDRFFPNVIEKATITLKSNTYFCWHHAGDGVHFERTTVTPMIKNGRLPQFLVRCRSANGDFIQFRIVPYDHAQLTMERPLFNSRRHSKFNYNEYMFRVEELTGHVSGQTIQPETVGNGFGNIEYTWGLGL